MKEKVQNVLRKFGYELHRVLPYDDTADYLRTYGKDSVENSRFYNMSGGGHLGFGGGFYHPCWTNVDIYRGWNGKNGYNPNLDINFDFFSFKTLPIETGSAELAHSRFTIEHLTDEAANHLFEETFRILKPGGVFKVVVPNIDLDYRAYIKGDEGYFNWLHLFSRTEDRDFMGFDKTLNECSLEQIFLLHFAANASTNHVENKENKISDDEFKEVIHNQPYQKALDYCTSRCSVEIQMQYRQNHINWWNYEKLQNSLSRAGFSSVYPLSPNQSSAAVMRNKDYFDTLWNQVALYMEAIK